MNQSFELMRLGLAELADIFPKKCLEPHLKDLFHICLEPKVQGHGITLNERNHGSK